MRDRRFGVEIECGYSGDGFGRYDRDCSCECYCESEREFLKQRREQYPDHGWYAQWTDEKIAEYECDVCLHGCTGDCEESYYRDDSEACEAAAYLLDSNGFGSWCHDIHADGSGVEIPSPILQGREGLRELQRVMELLRSNGFYTTEEDGMHVHHDVPEWVNNEPLTAHTVELWEENLDLIKRFVDRSRHENDMCASHKGGHFSYRDESPAWERFKESKNLSEVSGKFYGINITHIAYQGSLELRLHEGTLDFQKAAAWIKFGQGFLDFALKSYKRGEVITCQSRTELLRQARASSTTRRRLMAVERRVAVA